MEYIKTHIEGVCVLQPKVFGDARGYFMKTFRRQAFNEKVACINFVHDNESCGTNGVFRALHYQKGEFSQAKLARVVHGCVRDVSVELSDENKSQLFVSRGFAHGFCVLGTKAVFCYKVENVYAHPAECIIRFDDPAIGFKWQLPAVEFLHSPKELGGVLVRDAV